MGEVSSVCLEKRYIRKDGSVMQAELTCSILRDEGGKPELGVGMVVDISQRHRLEEQLRQAQKMQAVGTLAGGIAHEFNNMLQVMNGNVELALNALPPQSRSRRLLERVVSSGNRAAALVNQILQFSHQSERRVAPISLQESVDEALELLRPSIPQSISIEKEVDSNCRPIWADASEVQQAIINLCANAAYAMRRDGGKLMISQRAIQLAAEALSELPDLVEGRYALLEVKDNGPGMTESVRTQVFNPFYTTKDVGEGTGMGLAIVYGIVKKYGGTATVASEPGRGSTFGLYFPLAESV